MPIAVRRNRVVSLVPSWSVSTQQFAAGYLDGKWGLNGTADVLPYIILLIILLFKPHGLFGIHEIERV